MLLLMLALALQDTDRWVRDLSSDDPAVRDQAGDALARKGREAVPVLARLIESSDPDLGSRAEALLRKIGFPAVPLLGDSASDRLQKLVRQIVRDQAEAVLKEGQCYTVRWNDPPEWDPSTELDLGEGAGHGFSLKWIRIVPQTDGAKVRIAFFNQGRKPYASTWPLDEAPCEFKQALLPKGTYAAMLRVLATLGAATLVNRTSSSAGGSSSSFYTFARATQGDRSLYEAEFAGYWGTYNAMRFAKPLAATTFMETALKDLDLKESPLDGEERARWSQRFIRDWKRIGGEKQFYWWVKEYMLILIGAAGDASALPLLAEIIREGDPKARTTYFAINAATRLLGKDVRDKPVEEMDIESVRQKLLPLLGGK